MRPSRGGGEKIVVMHRHISLFLSEKMYTFAHFFFHNFILVFFFRCSYEKRCVSLFLNIFLGNKNLRTAGRGERERENRRWH